MTDDELKLWCEKEKGKKSVLVFSESMLNSFSEDQARLVVKELGGSIFMKLPEKEIKFFEWLKENDPAIWEDLWSNPDEEPYVVGISFLPLIIQKDGRGFPICDLFKNDNYYFSLSHMVDKESEMMLDSSKERFLKDKKLTIAQLLTVEISIAPIDIWHFAYKHKFEVEKAKEAVRQLVDDEVLVHFTDAEHLANFIDF